MSKRRNRCRAMVPCGEGSIKFNEAIDIIAAKEHRTLGSVANLLHCESYKELRLYLIGKWMPSATLIAKTSVELARVGAA